MALRFLDLCISLNLAAGALTAAQASTTSYTYSYFDDAPYLYAEGNFRSNGIARSFTMSLQDASGNRPFWFDSGVYIYTQTLGLVMNNLPAFYSVTGLMAGVVIDSVEVENNTSQYELVGLDGLYDEIRFEGHLAIQPVVWDDSPEGYSPPPDGVLGCGNFDCTITAAIVFDANIVDDDPVFVPSPPPVPLGPSGTALATGLAVFAAIRSRHPKPRRPR